MLFKHCTPDRSPIEPHSSLLSIISYTDAVKSGPRWYLSPGCQLSTGQASRAQQICMMLPLERPAARGRGSTCVFRNTQRLRLNHLLVFSTGGSRCVRRLVKGPRWSESDSKSMKCIPSASLLADIYFIYKKNKKKCLLSSASEHERDQTCERCQRGLTSPDFGINKQQSGHRAYWEICCCAILDFGYRCGHLYSKIMKPHSQVPSYTCAVCISFYIIRCAS